MTLAHRAGRPCLALLLLVAACPAPAAICTWNVAAGNWSVVGNWLGCADQPGPSTRTPGPLDTAIVPVGAASLDTDATVGQFEIGAAATLTLVGGAPRTLTVTGALRLAGGTVSTSNTGSFPILYLVLAPGATGQVLASTILANTVELQNHGQLHLQSATGTTLVFQGLARLINLPGSTFAVGGGNARVHLDGLAPLTIQAGATLATSGDVFIGRSLAAAGTPRIESLGTIDHTGPGTLTIQGSGSGASAAATFQVQGLLAIRNGTLLCNALADTCRHQNGSGGPDALRILLDNGHYGRGGPTALALPIPVGAELVGTGSIDGAVRVDGRLAPGADQGPPYGTLTITGSLQFNATSELAIDLGGSLPGTHDRVHVGGALTLGGSGFAEGLATLKLRLAPGYQPAMGEPVAVLTYGSVAADSALHRVDANYALDYATRFDPGALQVFPAPRLYLEETSVVEGNTGSAAVNVNVRLSQASALPVGARLLFTEGTASNGPLPAGDYVYPGPPTVQFAPGEVVKPVQVLIHGDLAPEADEAFTLSLVRNTISNAAVGNGVPGHPRGVITILTDDLPPDTRFVLVGKDPATAAGSIKRYTSTGTLIDVWGPTTSNGGGGLATGLCFGPGGTVLSTRFNHTNPILYSNAGAVLAPSFARVPGTFPFNFHESCTFDRDGDVYIGQAGGASSPDSAVPVRRFDRHGIALEDFVLPTGPRGTDWIELAGDQCTLYYTSEDTVVRRYNVCTRTVLPDFAVGLTPPVCYALRLRPNRELMVACQDAVHRISPQGANLQTYTRQSLGESNPQGLFALNLDPDGTSFWTAGGVSGWVYRVDIASGAVLTSFNSGPGAVGGLAIFDEPGDDTLFIDGFDTAPVPAPIVASGPSAHLYREMRRCEKEFSPRNVPLPQFVPYWVALVVVGANDCWH